MPISLSKGQKVDLTKKNPGLKKIMVGLGWDVNAFDSGADFDLDAAAFMLGANGKCPTEKEFIFYGNLKHASESVVHMGDNLTGEGDGDDEQIMIDLLKIPANIERIAFIVNDVHVIELLNAVGVVTLFERAERRLVPHQLAGVGLTVRRIRAPPPVLLPVDLQRAGAAFIELLHVGAAQHFIGRNRHFQVVRELFVVLDAAGNCIQRIFLRTGSCCKRLSDVQIF